MGHTARKVNFMLRNDIVDELKRVVPNGSRSEFVNNELIKELALYRRKLQTEKLFSLRRRAPVMTDDDLIATLNNDRERVV